MAARTFDQQISDELVKQIRARANGNTTFLIDTSINQRTTDRQNAVADELGTDAQITSRKLTTVPTAFGASDAVLCLGMGEPYLTQSGIKDKLRFAAEVRTIIGYEGFFDENEFENFEFISRQNISKTGAATRADTEQTTITIFERRKVDVQ